MTMQHHKCKGQGQSHGTEDKVRGFMSVFKQNIAAVKGITSRSTWPVMYFHFDLHGGSGWNEEVDVIGSPVLFAQLANIQGIRYVMHAAELDSHRAKSLGRMLRCDSSCFVRHGDNCDLVAEIPYIIRSHGEKPEYAYGTIVIDPNNPSGGVPYEGLSELFAECKRLDVIFNFPAGAMKRLRTSLSTTGGFSRIVRHPDMRQEWSKKYGQIRRPLTEHQFTLLVFRNTPWNDGHRAIGLYDIDSREGRQLLERAALTESERKKRQLVLPGM